MTRTRKRREQQEQEACPRDSLSAQAIKEMNGTKFEARLDHSDYWCRADRTQGSTLTVSKANRSREEALQFSEACGVLEFEAVRL